ncbi:MAG: metallophosphoesterase [Clostridia bacterium]|nr:metallophosphoesterase [Clostridia bacterium]
MRRKSFWLVGLCLCLLLSLMPVFPVVAATEDITIIACSDFQSTDYAIGGRKQVTAILDAMVADGITQADGFFCCGDYNIEVGLPNDIKVLTRAVNQIVDKDGHMVFAKGNHDEIGLEGLSPSGNNDPKSGAYGTYVIHENDYPWLYSNEYTVSRTAGKLKTYLDEKLQAGFNKPIFIISHLPLHFNRRTMNKNCGSCNGNLLFDVINEAAGKGLNIFFLFGHNHANGYDDYLGGSAIYLKKGDSINIAQCSRTDYKTETLNFTYMNAGYVGYYGPLYPGAGTDLTMTAFKISGNEVTVSRYSAAGLYNLKAKGVNDPNANLEGNPTVYASPRKVSVTDDVPVAVQKPTAGTTQKATVADTTTTGAGAVQTSATSQPEGVATTAATAGATADPSATAGNISTGNTTAGDVSQMDSTPSTSLSKEETGATVTTTAASGPVAPPSDRPVWPFIAGGGVLIVAGAIVVILLRRKSQK